MKQCSKCHTTQPYDLYYRDPAAPDGHKAACKSCIEGARAARRAPHVPQELTGPRPRCFTEDQWGDWVAAERDAGHDYPASGYCTSCTDVHQIIMKARGSCAYPTVTFRNVDGDVEGERQNTTSCG